MTRKPKLKLALAAPVGLVALAAAILVNAAVAASAGGPKAPAQQLSGTWLTTITLQNPPPGLAPSFRALDTFTSSGGLLVSSSQAMPNLRSWPAQGSWVRTGNRRFSSNFTWFRFDTTGAFVGMQRVLRTMTVSANYASFQATDTVQVLAPDGATVLKSLQANESGVRLPAS